ncbi:MAG TPA: hypothetical protein VGV15_10100 [Terriglobales bacterium]|nr:hypothetical protein [Terriglobales bacterium]
MAKKGWKPRRSDVEDQAKLQRRQDLAAKIELIAENLGEDDFVSVIKQYAPQTTPEELQDWIMLFRDVVRQKRGLF